MPSPDIQFIRDQFPALNEGYVYMDNAGGSQTAKQVVERISDYMLNTNVQLGASYEKSQISTNRVAQAAECMASFVNAAHVNEVVMGPSTSMLLKILSLCLVRGWQPGDEIIVTNVDHEANISPWRALAEKGMVVKTWKMNPNTAELDLCDLRELMTPKTRLVAFTHASNILGTVNPVKEITRVVHENGSLACVDAVAYAPHRAIDVQDWDVDFYAFSFYKVYGPHYALLYGKKALLESLPGINLGFIHETPYKFQPGNVNHELSYGMIGVVDYFKALTTHHYPQRPEPSIRDAVLAAYNLIETHEDLLSNRFLAFLRDCPEVSIFGKSEVDGARLPTISFTVKDRDSNDFALAVDPHKIGIRYGDFYAKNLISDHGLLANNGVVRVSLVHYNTLDEVDRLIAILQEAIQNK